MGADFAVDSAGQAGRQQAHGGRAIGRQRGDVYPERGCQWAQLPKDLPPRSTVNDYFKRWEHDGTLRRIHHALYVKCREMADRQASPTVGIIDSQSVKSAEKGGVRSTRRASMLARRSKARSATSSSIRRAC